MSQIQIKYPAISHLVCTQKYFFRCDNNGDYSAAFCSDFLIPSMYTEFERVAVCAAQILVTQQH